MYKGKGQKGKCSNERGITLASNVGKVYKRIINERVKKQITITKAQAGGKPGCATTDHLIVLKQTIQEIMEKKQTAYIIFLDVQKAYDKAWLDAIMYALLKNGGEGKNLRMIKKKPRSNITARIQTRYGLTRRINIKDSIRQESIYGFKTPLCSCDARPVLTHWGRMTHICISKLTIIGSDNDLSPGRYQAIIWTNAGLLSIGTLRTNFSEILSETNTFSFKKMHLKMSSAKWRPLCFGLNVLTVLKCQNKKLFAKIRLNGTPLSVFRLYLGLRLS